MKHYAIQVHTRTGPKWRFYCSKSGGGAKTMAEKKTDVLDVGKVIEITEMQYNKGLLGSDQHKPEKPLVKPVWKTKERIKELQQQAAQTK